MQQEQRAPTARTDRIELRTTPHEKAILAKAAALEHLDMTNFVMRVVVPAAREVIDRSERIQLSERDTLLMLQLLENPPPPNAKLIAAMAAASKQGTELDS